MQFIQYASLFLIMFFSTPIFAGNTLCNKIEDCKCSRGEVPMLETYGIPGRGKTTVMYNCVAGLNPKKFLSCMNKLTEPIQSCNCGEKIECIDGSGTLNPTLQTGIVAPSKCHYREKGFSLNDFKQVIKNYVDNEDEINCEKSNESSAVFLAWVNLQKEELKRNRITQAEFNNRINVEGEAYKLIAESAEPNKLIEKFELGTGIIQHAKDGQIGKNSEYPRAGDFIQIWTIRGDGVSAIFKGYKDNNGDGVNDEICYWSSQVKTLGYGNRCQKIPVVDKLLIGSLY